MESALKNFLEKIQFGEQKSYKNMLLIPFVYKNGNKFDYVLADDLVKEQKVKIIETGNVTSTKIRNDSDKRVLILAGQQILGAKQNRVINVTVILEKNSELNIPVNCVEQGRWFYRRRSADLEYEEAPPRDYNLFDLANNTVNAGLRNNIEFQAYCIMQKTKGREISVDQSMVWNVVHKFLDKGNVRSSTSALNDYYVKKEKEIKEYIDNISLENGYNGFIVYVNGKLLGMDYFNKEEYFKKSAKKLLNGYIAEAVAVKKIEGEIELEIKPEEFINELKNAKYSEFPSIGLGKKCFLEGEKAFASALIAEDEVIQFFGSIKPKENLKENDFYGYNYWDDEYNEDGIEILSPDIR